MNIEVLDADKFRRYFFGEDVDRIVIDNRETYQDRRVWGFRGDKQVFAALLGEDPPVLLG